MEKELPDARLAREVVALLVTQGLISNAKREEVRRKLEAGTMQEQDWRFYAEESIDRSERGKADEPSHQ